MFKAPFSFSGRITRTEYLVSCLLSFMLYMMGVGIMLGSNEAAIISVFIWIPAFWFAAAQGWKRSHDAGWHGIVAIIPYASFVLFFVSGDQGTNAYGPNPRLNGTEQASPSSPQEAFAPPPLPDAWERARQAAAPTFRTSSFKCAACGAQNTDVEHQGTACCQFCGAPKA
jgi:uncharacterized membrane protein YhaH (DUF805 family)